MTQIVSPISVFREAVHLLTIRPTHTMGLLALAFAISGVLPYFIPESFLIGVLPGMLLAMSYVNLRVIANLVSFSGPKSEIQEPLLKAAGQKFVWYFLYSLIAALVGGLVLGFCMSVIVASTLDPAIIVEASQDKTGLALLGYLAENGQSLILAGIIGTLALNLVLTAWFLVPVVMVTRGMELNAMGKSVQLVRPFFWNVYLISLFALIVGIFTSVFQLWLIYSGQLASNILNSALLGVPQGVGYTLFYALAVVTWQKLEEQAN